MALTSRASPGSILVPLAPCSLAEVIMKTKRAGEASTSCMTYPTRSLIMTGSEMQVEPGSSHQINRCSSNTLFQVKTSRVCPLLLGNKGDLLWRAKR